MVTHLGMYGGFSRKDATKNIISNIAIIQEWYNESEIKIPVGLETSGRQEIFGEFSEIEKVCESVNGLVPVINFPHIHARGNGALKKKEDFQDLFDRANKFTKGRFYTHFSGVEHENGNEIRYTPIKKGDLKFEPLAECILENDMELTVISGSPLLEHDAMYMKVILERVLAKREAKAEREKEKEGAAPEPVKKTGKQAAKPSPKKAPVKTTKKPQAQKAVAKKKAPAKPKAKPAKKPVKSKPTPEKPAPKPKKPIQKAKPKKPSMAPPKKAAKSKKAIKKKPIQTVKKVSKPPKKAAKVPVKQPVKKPAKKPAKAPAKKNPPKKK